MRAFDLACTIPWAIRPDALQAMLGLAARAEVSPEVVAAAMSGSTQAVAARLGRPMDNARRVEIRGGSAIIPINGPIFRYAGMFTEVSGATSTEVLATDLQAALDNPAVASILLNVDSPGGEVAGTAELAAMIHAASARKPVFAYVDDLGASAGYWLASAADRIVVAPTALVGSIGVVSALRDPSKTSSKEVEFVSSQSPKKSIDVSTESGRAQIQEIVDALAAVFVGDVARYRGVSPDTVLADFGQGGVFVGQAAVDAGLADAVGSFEQALADLGEEAAGRGPSAGHTNRMMGHGMSFDDHSASVQVAVVEWVERVKAGTATRARDGRALSGARRLRMEGVADALRDAVGDIDALLTNEAPPPIAVADETGAQAQRVAVLRLRSEFVQGSLRRARTLGVTHDQAR